MTHEELRDRLLDLAYGELPPRDARAVEEHATGCEACRTELARIRGTRQLMSALPVEPAPEAGARILVAAAREAVRGKEPRRALPRWLWATPVVAASAAVAIALSLRLGDVRPPSAARDDRDALLGSSPYAAAPAEAPAASPEPGGAAPERAAPGAGARNVEPPRGAAQRTPPSPPPGERVGERGPSREAARADRERSLAAEKKAAPRARDEEQASPYATAPPPEGPAAEDRAAAGAVAAAPLATPPSAAPPASAPHPSGAARAPAPPAAAPRAAAPSPSGGGPVGAMQPPAPTPRAPTEGKAEAEAAPARRAKAMAAPEPGPGHGAADGAGSLEERNAAAVARYEELRRSGRLRAEFRSFPGCAREPWRRIERDPDGRIVAYAWEALAGTQRLRFEAIYAPDGTLASKRAVDLGSGAPETLVKFRVPRPSEIDLDAPTVCDR